MYTCETCNKTYKSQKRYLSHIEQQCNETRSRSRSRSRGGISDVSDIEDAKSRSRSRGGISEDAKSRSRSKPRSLTRLSSSSSLKEEGSELLDKLQRDRVRLKSEIKKYKQELRDRVTEHREEIDRIQDQYQEQIYRMQEHNDELQEQVNLANDSIFDEKERLRTDFARKIQQEKQRLQVRYGDQNNSNVSRLNSSLEKLQERVAKQMEEREKLRIENEKILIEREEQYQTQVDSLNSQLITTKRSIDKEREDIRQTTLLLNQEKESIRQTLKQEHDDHVETLQIEYRNTIEALERKCTSLSKQIETITESHKEALENMTTTHHSEIKERNSIISRLKENHKRAVEFNKQQADGQLQNTIHKHELDIERMKHEHQNAMHKVKAKYDQDISNIKSEISQTIEKCNDQVRDMKQKVVDVETKAADQIRKQNVVCEEKLSEINKLHLQTVEELKETHRIELLESTTERDETISDLEKLNHALGSQLGQYKTAMTNMESDVSNIKKQFLTTLNEQQSGDQKAIKEREDRINTLIKDIESLNKECNKKLNDARIERERISIDLDHSRKDAKLKGDALDEAKDSYQRIFNERESIVKNYEERIQNIKKDFIQKLNSVKKDVETTTEQKYVGELEKARIELSEYLRIHGKEMGKLQNANSTAEAKIARLNNELEKINIVAIDAEKYKKMYGDLDGKNREFTATVNKQIHDYKEQLRELTVRLDEKERALKEMSDITANNKDMYAKQLDKLSVDRNELITAKDEIHRLITENRQLSEQVNNPPKNRAVEDRLKKMRDETIKVLQENKLKLKASEDEVAQLNKKIEIMEAVAKEKDNKVVDIDKKEKELKKDFLDKMNEQRSMYEARISEYEKQSKMTEQKINNLKSEYNRNLNSYEQKISTSYEQKIKDQQSQHSQMIYVLEQQVKKYQVDLEREKEKHATTNSILKNQREEIMKEEERKFSIQKGQLEEEFRDKKVIMRNRISELEKLLVKTATGSK